MFGTLTPRIFGVRQFQNILGKVELEFSPFLALFLCSSDIRSPVAADLCIGHAKKVGPDLLSGKVFHCPLITPPGPGALKVGSA